MGIPYLAKPVLLVALMLFCESGAWGQGPITVPATANGEFGEASACSTPLVPAFRFVGGQKIRIVTSGRVGLAGVSSSISPTGVSIDSGVLPAHLFPLEEAYNDGGGSPAIAPSNASRNVGALIAAFVPESAVSAVGFEALDEDTARYGIPSASLFLVGNGVFRYSAPGPGTLFLGVNSTDTCNTTGSFSARVSVLVDVDVFPGDSSSVVFGLPTVIPVAVLSSDTFDAPTVDHGSLILYDARGGLVGASSQSACTENDVNGDGRSDLVCSIQTVSSATLDGPAQVVLEGRTRDGLVVRGEGFVHIVAASQ